MGTYIDHRNNRAFTLIEVMVVVALIAVLAAIAIPSFNRYVLESRRAEGVRLLMTAYRDQQMYRQVAGTDSYTEFFEDENGVKLPTRYSSKSRYNLIVGAQAEDCSGQRKCYLSQYGGVSIDIPGAPINRGFGLALKANNDVNAAAQLDPHRFMIGAETTLDGGNFLDVIMVNEEGHLIQICDGINKSIDTAGANFYQTNSYNHSTPNCLADAGSSSAINAGGGGSNNGGGDNSGSPDNSCPEPPCD